MAEGGDPPWASLGTKGESSTEQQNLTPWRDVPDVPSREDLSHSLQFSPSVWRAFLEKKALPMTDKQKDNLLTHWGDFVHRLDVTDVIDYLFADGVLSEEQQEEVLNCRQKSTKAAMRKLMNIVSNSSQQGYYSMLRALYVSAPKPQAAALEYSEQTRMTSASKVSRIPTETMQLQLSSRGSVHEHHKKDCIEALNKELYKCCLLQDEPSLQITDKDSQLATTQINSLMSDAKAWESLLSNSQGEIGPKQQELLLDHNVAMVNTLDPKRILPSLEQDGMVSKEQVDVILKKESQQEGMRVLLGVIRMRGHAGFLSLCKAVMTYHEQPQIIYNAKMKSEHKIKIYREVKSTKMGKIDDYIKLALQLNQEYRTEKRRAYNLLEIESPKEKTTPILPHEFFTDKPEWNDTEVPRIVCFLGKITKDPSKVLVMLDGLDEYVGFNEKSTLDFENLCDHDRKTTFPTLLLNLYLQNLLPGATIAFTSRPRAAAFSCIQDFQRKIFIAGFDEEQIEKYVKTYFREDKQKLEWAMKWLQEHRDVMTYCYIPVFLNMICNCLSQLYSSKGQGLSPWHKEPHTLTQLMALLISFFIMEHHTDLKDKKKPRKLQGVIQPYRSSFLALARLASTGMESLPPKITFNEDDLTSMGIKSTSKEWDFGLLTAAKDEEHPILGTTEEFTQFIHLLIQEFMAACHWLGYSWTQIEGYLSKMEQGHYDMVILFLFGLLVDPSLREDLQVVFPEGVTVEFLEKKAISLLQFLADRKTSHTKEECLLLLMILYQGQQPAMVKEAGRWVISKDGKLNLSHSQMTSVESQALAYFLQHTHYRVDSIKLAGNPLGNQGLRYLCPGLISIASNLQFLGLSSIDIGDTGLEELVHVLRTARLDKLMLGNNKLTGASLDVLCKELCADKLEHLYLHDNPSLMSDGVEALTIILLPRSSKLQCLWLYSTGLSEKGALQLAAAQKEHCPQCTLQLGGSDIFSDKFKNQMKQILGDEVIFY